MVGEYIEYCGNVYRITGFNHWEEIVKVELFKLHKEKLCSNEVHAQFLQEGKMWLTPFFEKAKRIHNGALVYEKA